MQNIADYDYTLPRERIAQAPLRNRVDARLMIVNRADGSIDHAHIRDLPDLLRAEDVLVRNDSRVVPARLIGHRELTGGRWQGLYLRHDRDSGFWELLTKTRGTLQTGETIVLEDHDARPGDRLVVAGRTDEGHLVAKPVAHADGTTPAVTELLERHGRIPIPPYIRDGRMVDADRLDYQTVFAGKDDIHRGSVAAPTAGLHFTRPLLAQIQKGQTAIADVTLHVGLGTFEPVSAATLDEHRMHFEWGRIEPAAVDLINDRRGGGGRCVAVGTTSTRVLESAAAAGGGRLQPWTGQTDLFIRPGFEFKTTDALLTNFHLPKSTLLVLVSALAGRELIMRAYAEAIEQEYRFYSYGDAMLIV